jgi:RNA polymerase sigma-70 factor (ECF subfamily)
MTDDVRSLLDTLYRTESRRVLATLIRLLGGFELAEEALHDAFTAALTRWPNEGIPAHPRAWLVSAGRFKGIDSLRRRARFDASQAQLASALPAYDANATDDDTVEDDQLRLIFTCCHPALSADAQIALTLREVCGLTTEEIARAFFTTPSTVAQRIVRAKSKIRDANIPYHIPERPDLPGRLDTVLHVVYLVFNEGYAPSAGDVLTRQTLSTDAIRLGRLLAGLMPEPEVQGLLALMLLHESRRPARTDAFNDIVLLDAQDRALWNREMMAEGCALVEQALRSRRFGPYTLQAAIAAVHAEAETAAHTDWTQIAGLYDVLYRVEPTAVVALNRAVAIAMRDGPAAGVRLINALLADGELADYHLAHSAHAALCAKLGDVAQARVSYARAMQLARLEPERRHIAKQLELLHTT